MKVLCKCFTSLPHPTPHPCHRKPLFTVRLRALSRNLMVWNSDSLLGTLTPFFFFCFLCANSFQTRQVNEIVRSDLRQWSKDKATTRGRIKAKHSSCLVFSLAHSMDQASSLPCPDTSVGMVVFNCDPYNSKFMLFWKGRLKNLVSRKKKRLKPL